MIDTLTTVIVEGINWAHALPSRHQEAHTVFHGIGIPGTVLVDVLGPRCKLLVDSVDLDGNLTSTITKPRRPGAEHVRTVPLPR